MYRYSETSKHHLTRELIQNDLKQDARATKIMAMFVLFINLLGALAVTLFIYLIIPSAMDVSEDSLGIRIAVAVVWIIAAAVMILFGKILIDAYKPQTIPDFHVSKRRLDTIARDEYQYTSYIGGRAHAVYRDVFYLEGMSKYYPSQTQLDLAEEGDMYYVVTCGETSTTPIRIYRADAYIWNG